MTGERPLAQLRQVMDDYPHLARLSDEFRAMRGKELDWPDWCFLPMAASYSIVSAHQGGRDPIPLSLVPDIARISALNAWRFSRGIYRFHPALEAALAHSPISGDMPTEVFLRLPEWCLYVELPSPVGGLVGAITYGFYAHLEHDANTGRAELRLLLDEDDGLHAIPLHIGPWTLLEALDRTVQESLHQANTHKVSMFGQPIGPTTVDVADRLTGMISLLLYLCSTSTEISDPTRPGSRPSRPRPTKTKKGWRLFPAQKATVWEVGGQLGEQLHHADVDQGYWYGSQEGDRYLYRWISTAGGL